MPANFYLHVNVLPLLPPPPPPPAQPNVNQKKEGTSMAEHAGQWLYEERMAYWDGLRLENKSSEPWPIDG